MRTILLGKPITSDEALAAGLVCDVFEDGKVLDGAIEAAIAMAQRPPMALQLAKEAICRGSLSSSLPICLPDPTRTPPNPLPCPISLLGRLYGRHYGYQKG